MLVIDVGYVREIEILGSGKIWELTYERVIQCLNTIGGGQLSARYVGKPISEYANGRHRITPVRAYVVPR